MILLIGAFVLCVLLPMAGGGGRGAGGGGGGMAGRLAGRTNPNSGRTPPATQGHGSPPSRIPGASKPTPGGSRWNVDTPRL